MDKPTKYAQHFVKLELMKARLEVTTMEIITNCKLKTGLSKIVNY